MAYKQKINPRTGKFDMVSNGGGGEGGIQEVKSADKTVNVTPTADGVNLSVNHIIERAITPLADDKKIPTSKAVLDFVETEKGKLKVLRVSGAKTTPKRFIEINPVDGTAYYKLTAMVMGASGNPDFFGLLEVSFGYGRPGSNPDFCYAHWVAFTEGNPSAQQYKTVPEIKILVSEDKQKMIVGAVCPADTYQTLELHVISEDVAYGTATYGTNSTADVIPADFLSGATEVEIEDMSLQADEEDLTSKVIGKLQLKDREATTGNMGYVILRKDKTFAEQVTKANTIYEIRYEFEVGGTEADPVVIPENCVLKFEGGRLENGVLRGTNTLVPDYCVLGFDDTCILTGQWETGSDNITNRIQKLTPLSPLTGGVATNAGIGNVCPKKLGKDSTYYSWIIDVNEGDLLLINTYSGSNYGAFASLDAEDRVISNFKCEIIDYIYKVPSNVRTVIVNHKIGSTQAKGTVGLIRNSTYSDAWYAKNNKKQHNLFDEPLVSVDVISDFGATINSIIQKADAYDSIYIPNGMYQIKSPIVVDKPISIVCDGKLNVSMDLEDYLFQVKSSDVEINVNNVITTYSTNSGVLRVSSDEDKVWYCSFHFHNINFYKTKNNPILIEATSASIAYIRISGSLFTGNNSIETDSIRINPTNNFISEIYISQIRFTKFNFPIYLDSGIGSTSETLHSVSSCVISEVTFEGNKHALYAKNVRSLEINHCRDVEQMNATGADTYVFEGYIFDGYMSARTPFSILAFRWDNPTYIYGINNRCQGLLINRPLIEGGNWIANSGYLINGRLEFGDTPFASSTERRPTLNEYHRGKLYYDTSLSELIYWSGYEWKRISDGFNANYKKRGYDSERPTELLPTDAGYCYYSTSLDRPIWWNGSAWVDLKPTVTPTLTTGTEIANINGTKIYAPIPAANVLFPQNGYIPVAGLNSGSVLRVHFATETYPDLCLSYFSKNFASNLLKVGATIELDVTTDVTISGRNLQICTLGSIASHIEQYYALPDLVQNKLYRITVTVTAVTEYEVSAFSVAIQTIE